MTDISTGTATITIDRPPAEVWAAITDITRMGDWSPECVAGRWVAPADGPAIGAEFEGDNVARFAGRTVKAWTTTSVVTVFDAPSTFAFVAEGYTTWTYTLEPVGSGTRVTERFEYTPAGLQGFLYEKVMGRNRMMTKGMQRTLERVKAALEA